MKKYKKYDVVIYIVLAYIFSLLLRMTWVYEHINDASYKWGGQLMINTNDGYFFATAIKHLLFGTNMDNPLLLVAINTYTGTIYSIYFLAKILPFSLDTIILYAPMFISSLVVIPIILIMRLYNKTFLGFLSALLASIAWSYYNRTMVGYFDTDMFALVFPVFILYFLIKFVRNTSILDIFIMVLIAVIYEVFYPQGYAALTAIFITFVIYGYIFLRENINFYKALIVFAFSLFKVILAIKLIIFAILYFIFIKKDFKEKYYKNTSIFMILLVLIFSGGIDLIINKLDWYIRKGTLEDQVGLHFYDVAQTISEASRIPFTIFADRITGSVLGFFIAVVGYVLLAWRKKEMLLFLPLVAIGFFAYKGGLRFTVYAIPALSMGAIYLFWEISKLINPNNKKIQYSMIFFASLALIYPNIKHIQNYNKIIGPVFRNGEVKDLEKLNKISDDKDYTLTWWDYGYPIWYYSETNTLIDGGKHHNDNYIVSKILQTDSPLLAANLSRLAIERYTNAIKSYKNYIKHDKDNKYIPKKFLLYKKGKVIHTVGNGYGAVAESIFEGGAKKLQDPQKLLDKLGSSEYKPPKKSRDIYFYMPLRMVNIFSTVMIFGNINLLNGKKLRDSMFYPAYIRGKNGSKLFLTNNLVFDTKEGLVYFGKNALKIRYFVETKRDSNGDINLKPMLYHKDGNLAVVYLNATNQIIVMDMKTFKSMYVQMGLLGQYDKDLFELVVKSPYSRIYKLKR